MNSKDIEKVFNLLGTGVTAITYVKDGYVIAIAPPAKKAAVPNPLNKELKKVYPQGKPGIIDCSNYAPMQAAINKYRHNSNYSLYVIHNTLYVRQHDLSGCTHTALVKNLDIGNIDWCKSLGVEIK
jgi:hypothetical protein